MKATEFPKDLNGRYYRRPEQENPTSFNDLVNSIVIGFILVLIILMFFMGVTNAFFVALSVPLSMFVAFLFLPAADLIIGTHVTLNFIVLFALLFGLGYHRRRCHRGDRKYAPDIYKGRVKLSFRFRPKGPRVKCLCPCSPAPLPSLHPSFRFLFWPGLIGKFMIYLPAMLIFTLAASLIVAFIMNPVFAVDFMNHPEEEKASKKSRVFRNPLSGSLAVWYNAGPVMHFTSGGNLLILFRILMFLNTYVFDRNDPFFSKPGLPWIMGHYESCCVGTERLAPGLVTDRYFFPPDIFLCIPCARKVRVVFFPKGDPNHIMYILNCRLGPMWIIQIPSLEYWKTA